jgi:phosphoribosylformimino-5-aminoimidazole carboxamide ribotide isomerase
VNRSAVEGILKVFPGHVQLGGGIRNPIAVDGWFDLGVSRVVIGTAALKDPQFVKDMAKAYPGGIVVAVDARDGMVATEGWAEVSDVSIVEHGEAVRGCGRGLRSSSPTWAATGCSRAATSMRRSIWRAAPGSPVIASGGVKGIDDIRMLKIHEADGIEGVITGPRAVRGAARPQGSHRDGRSVRVGA